MESTEVNLSQSNISHYIPKLAQLYPDKIALRYLMNGRYEVCTFSQFENLTNQYAKAFKKIGITYGTRVIVLIKHTFEFYSVIFSLYKVGAIPVVIDPGMKRKSMLECMQSANATAFIGIPLAHVFRIIYRKYFASLNVLITVGKTKLWGGYSLQKLKKWNLGTEAILENTKATDLAAILFTSGSTGVPKGVEYEHGMFDGQVKSIQEMYCITPEHSDLPCFPLFGLFSLAMGASVTIPNMNPAKPGEVNPLHIIEPILKFEITNCFASPAVWDKVSKYCVNHQIKLPSLKIALSAGAPVAGPLVKRLCEEVLPIDGDLFTPYGATESLPVSSINGRMVLSTTQMLTNQGKGTCVGKLVKGVKVKIIEVRDGVIESLDQVIEKRQGEIGEIIVNSPTVTRQYFNSEEKTRLAKIKDGATFWHRIGDVGYFDEKQNLWFCGRKDHVVDAGGKVYYSVPCEEIFLQHKQVAKAALVGLKEGQKVLPVILIELELGVRRSNSLAKEILSMGDAFAHTKDIKKIAFYDSFPVDVRHNAKINREELTVWANQNPGEFLT